MKDSEETTCVSCGRTIWVLTNYRYDPLCRKCIKSERAERKRFSKFFLRKELAHGE